MTVSIRIVVLVVVASALAFAQPVVSEGGVINGASFAAGQPVAPGSLVSIFGSDLAAGLAQADSIPLATQMLDTRVFFNGVPSPLLLLTAGDAGQINAQMPWEALGGGGGAGNAAVIGTVQVVVERGGVQSPPVAVDIADFAPGIFAVQVANGSVIGFGRGQAIAINPDGTLAGPTGSITGIATRPARRGEVIQVLATGLGEVSPPPVTGDNSLDQLRLTTTPPTALIGGVEAPGAVAALSPEFVGIHQVNVPVPDNAQTGDNISLQIRMGDTTSTDEVVISIE